MSYGVEWEETMKDRRVPLGLAALLAVVGVFGAIAAVPPAAHGGAGQDKQIKVGIVNMKHCFDESKCERVKELQKQLKELKDKIEAELQDLQKQVQTLDSKIKGLANPEGPLFKKFRQERAELLGKAKVKEELGKVELQEFWRKSRGNVYDEVCKAVDVVAKAKGLDLVLKDDAPAQDETDQEKAQVPSDLKIVYRAILFYSDKFDITKDVLQKMNEEWQKENKPNK